MKRRGNRRYYQHHEVLLVRRIRELLYEQGFTISGARNRLGEGASSAGRRREPMPLEADTPQTLPAVAEVACVSDLRNELNRILLLLEP